MPVDPSRFTPTFLQSRTVPELTVLQHELRRFPEDRPYLDLALAAFQRRTAGASAPASKSA